MTARKTPGIKLRQAMTEALKATSADLGEALEFDEVETEALQVACDAADRRESLQKVFVAELAGQARPATLAKISAELRGLEKAQLDALGRIALDPDADQKKAQRLSQIRREAGARRNLSTSRRGYGTA